MIWVFSGIRSRRVRRVRRQGVFRISKMIYVVKTTEFEVDAFAEHGDRVFSGFRKRFTLLKQRNSKSARPPSTATGYFPDSQNDLRCQNNGIRSRNVRRARRHGVFRTPKTIYVVKTTEFEVGAFAEHGDRVFPGFRKRFTLLKQRNCINMPLFRAFPDRRVRETPFHYLRGFFSVCRTDRLRRVKPSAHRTDNFVSLKPNSVVLTPQITK